MQNGIAIEQLFCDRTDRVAPLQWVNIFPIVIISVSSEVVFRHYIRQDDTDNTNQSERVQLGLQIGQSRLFLCGGC